jgi:glucan 1,3-beta-glucosidase
MSSAAGTQHQGVFIESGSGGFMTDLTFYGGFEGFFLANQYVSLSLVAANVLTPASQAVYNAKSHFF